jgi:cobalt-zinc-cadmium efflux system membrane fusion protein
MLVIADYRWRILLHNMRRCAFLDCLKHQLGTISSRWASQLESARAGLHDPVTSLIKRAQALKGIPVIVVGAVLALAVIAASYSGTTPPRDSDVSSQSRRSPGRYLPTPAEWASLTIEPVTARSFRAEHVTEGKIAVDEDRATPVFSPYAGRIIKLLARPGDRVDQGQPLFVIEAADTVQAQNDFVAAATGLNKTKSALDLAQIQNRRAKDLFEGKAVPLKDYQQTQATLTQAQNDVRSASTAL